MADKEAVLASLNINAMTFNKVTSTSRPPWSPPAPSTPSSFRLTVTHPPTQHDSVPVDFGPAGSSVRSGEVYGAKVRMVLTEVWFLSIIIKAVVDVGNTFSFTKPYETLLFRLSMTAIYNTLTLMTMTSLECSSMSHRHSFTFTIDSSLLILTLSCAPNLCSPKEPNYRLSQLALLLLYLFSTQSCRPPTTTTKPLHLSRALFLEVIHFLWLNVPNEKNYKTYIQITNFSTPQCPGPLALYIKCVQECLVM